MSIVVTGASGNLGRLVIEGLQEVPADQITAVVRSEEKAAALAARGTRIAIADYDSPGSFDDLFSTVTRCSSSSPEFAGCVRKHKAVIDAAKADGVALFAHTSALGTLTDALADDHRQTEATIIESGLPYTLLRNGWYHENYTEQLAPVLRHHAVTQAAGQGRIASAARADYAAAAVAVLTGNGHQNKTYELTGDTAYSFADYAAELSRQTGEEISYHAVSAEAFIGILTNAGVPRPLAPVLAGVEKSVERGEMGAAGSDLSRLIGRPTTPIADSIVAALQSQSRPTGR